MQIGNDIIDLLIERSDADRFAQRTMSPKELAAIENRPEDFPLICYFGVKEAFYKCVKQSFSEYSLKPRGISVDFSTRSIADDLHEHRFNCSRNREFFFSWTIPPAGHHYVNAVALLPVNFSNDAESESKGVRDLAKLVLSGLYGLPADEYSFVKGMGGEPVPMHGSDMVACGMSFTHHGRYCAVSVAAEGLLTTQRTRQINAFLSGKTVFANVQNIK